MSIFPEDPNKGCGWRFLRLFRKRKKDPYDAACVWHDDATSPGTWTSENLTPERKQEHFEDMMDVQDEIQKRNPNNSLKKTIRMGN